ncbi:hypothetical protein GQ457_11G022540 [Hibiscus cannabinus]
MSLKEELKELKRPVSSWPSSVDRVKTSIFPTSRMEECRIILAKAGRFPHLFRIAGPESSWPSSFDRVKTSIFPTSRMEECRPVSSWPSSFDRVKTSIFPTSRMEECRPMSSWPSSFDRVKTSIFPTSRMEECRIILAKAGLFPHLFRITGPVSSWPSSEISNTGREQSCRTLQPEGKHEEKGRVISPFLQVGRPKKMLLQVRKAHLLQGSVLNFRTDWICQLNDFGRKGPESATTYYFRLKFCLIPSGAKEQTQRIESFDLASSGSKEQIEVVTQCPWMRRNTFGQIKIGAFWSLPDSRFSAMCKEGQL